MKAVRAANHGSACVLPVVDSELLVSRFKFDASSAFASARQVIVLEQDSVLQRLVQVFVSFPWVIMELRGRALCRDTSSFRQFVGDVWAPLSDSIR
jgi:hypothetical protein